jgi:hypothetical protein
MKILKQPKKQATRFPPNPEEYWGPKRKAGRSNAETKKAKYDAAADDEGMPCMYHSRTGM